ncbi:MAG: sulfurtransferase TusA family protein [Armatimonadetes bacterium]|nr:sulfurtransferase TusA family protein [Armatimonadota bacterium]MCX7968008.1 sulfurtransferase TusA family protein [Armatimonadota bacterium]MDW8142055.1 sulfurtransferase TusA family protein [Armatimonadota bacterium]
MDEKHKRIDLTGKRCVLVTAALAEALASVPSGETVEAFSDDPVAHILVRRWCKDTGNDLVIAEKQNSGWRLLIRKGRTN